MGGPRLLVMACSQRKAATKQFLPALLRYDGPAFQVLRKYLREHPSAREQSGLGLPDDLAVLILSAKFGLIAADQLVPRYDRRITAERARTLRPQALELFADTIAARPWEALGLCLGADYAPGLDGFAAWVPDGVRIDRLGGGLGPRLTALRNWLRFPASSPC